MIYVQIDNNSTTCGISRRNCMTIWDGSRIQRTERALVLLCHTYVSFMYDTFVVMVTSHMNKDMEYAEESVGI